MAIHLARRTRLVFALLAGFAASQSSAVPIPDLHLEQDMEGAEYLSLWNHLERIDQAPTIHAGDPLSEILNFGKRNLQWIDLINANRDEANKLELSTPENQIGYPIDSPRESNREIVSANFTAFKAQIPQEIAAVLFTTVALPINPPTDDQTFLKYALDFDRIYQAASRWLLQEPYLWQYSSFARKDVRGYHFLAREENLNDKLTTWASQPDAIRAKLTPWLVNICYNGGASLNSCRTELAGNKKAANAKAFYDKYVNAARKLYEGFFAVQNPRQDANYTSANPNQFVLPFKTPALKDVENWLRDNIQDEWRFNGFQLLLNFILPGTGSAYVTFDPGATPHVDGLGGSHITMDANRNIQEYTSRWTIRHEFGHVIGFPDCYIEYYDSEREVMINYQIDITNLMCSRRGHLQEQHITALQKAYWKKGVQK